MVISLNVGLVCSCAGFLGFCDISISYDGNYLAGGEIVLYLCVGRVLISRRCCSGYVEVLFFSVGSAGRVKFGARDESCGCGGGLFCFAYSVSSFLISTMAISSVITLMMLESS